jgi:hypothetical protein
VADPGFKSPYAARIAQLIKEQEGLETAPMPQMFSPDELARRQAENMRNRQLGTLGELSGDKPLMGAGGQILKQAIGEQQRRITEHGEYDPLSGQLQVFPEYTRKQRTDRLAKEQSRMTELESRDYAKWLSDRQKADERAFLAQMSGGQSGTFNFAGVDAAGKPILMHSKSGQFVQPGEKPGTFTPYSGEVRQRGAFEKESKELEGFEQTGGKIKETLKMLDTPEGGEAFGMGVSGGLTALTPSPARGIVNEALFTPEQLTMRANVYEQAYQVAHALAGAAMSFGEQIRLDPFIPQPGDPHSVVVAKMTAAQQKYNELTTKIKAKREVAGSSQGPGPGIQPGATSAQSGNSIRYDAQGNRQR